MVGESGKIDQHDPIKETGDKVEKKAEHAMNDVYGKLATAEKALDPSTGNSQIDQLNKMLKSVLPEGHQVVGAGKDGTAIIKDLDTSTHYMVDSAGKVLTKLGAAASEASTGTPAPDSQLPKPDVSSILQNPTDGSGTLKGSGSEFQQEISNSNAQGKDSTITSSSDGTIHTQSDVPAGHASSPDTQFPTGSAEQNSTITSPDGTIHTKSDVPSGHASSPDTQFPTGSAEQTGGQRPDVAHSTSQPGNQEISPPQGRPDSTITAPDGTIRPQPDVPTGHSSSPESNVPTGHGDQTGPRGSTNDFASIFNKASDGNGGANPELSSITPLGFEENKQPGAGSSSEKNSDHSDHTLATQSKHVSDSDSKPLQAGHAQPTEQEKKVQEMDKDFHAMDTSGKYKDYNVVGYTQQAQGHHELLIADKNQGDKHRVYTVDPETRNVTGEYRVEKPSPGAYYGSGVELVKVKPGEDAPDQPYPPGYHGPQESRKGHVETPQPAPADAKGPAHTDGTTTKDSHSTSTPLDSRNLDPKMFSQFENTSQLQSPDAPMTPWKASGDELTSPDTPITPGQGIAEQFAKNNDLSALVNSGTNSDAGLSNFFQQAQFPNIQNDGPDFSQVTDTQTTLNRLQSGDRTSILTESVNDPSTTTEIQHSPNDSTKTWEITRNEDKMPAHVTDANNNTKDYTYDQDGLKDAQIKSADGHSSIHVSRQPDGSYKEEEVRDGGSPDVHYYTHATVNRETGDLTMSSDKEMRSMKSDGSIVDSQRLGDHWQITHVSNAKGEDYHYSYADKNAADPNKVIKVDQNGKSSEIVTDGVEPDTGIPAAKADSIQLNSHGDLTYKLDPNGNLDRAKQVRENTDGSTDTTVQLEDGTTGTVHKT